MTTKRQETDDERLKRIKYWTGPGEVAYGPEDANWLLEYVDKLRGCIEKLEEKNRRYEVIIDNLTGKTDPPTGPNDMPLVPCPRCGRLEEDFDGFGILAHTKPAYEHGCGYCSHPARAGDVCEICGEYNNTGRYVCRNYDPQGTVEDEYGTRVDPASCRICGFTKDHHGWNS